MTSTTWPASSFSSVSKRWWPESVATTFTAPGARPASSKRPSRSVNADASPAASATPASGARVPRSRATPRRIAVAASAGGGAGGGASNRKRYSIVTAAGLPSSSAGEKRSARAAARAASSNPWPAGVTTRAARTSPSAERSSSSVTAAEIPWAFASGGYSGVAGVTTAGKRVTTPVAGSAAPAVTASARRIGTRTLCDRIVAFTPGETCR